MTTFDDRPFWRPRDLAELLGVDPSTVYRMIETGELDHVKIGARTVRVPAESVAAKLSRPAPAHAEPSIRERFERFVDRTGREPVDYTEAWKTNEIADTPENVRDLIEALALREMTVTA